ncbi:DUF3742 family protein [Burkholderia cenocepacia]|uniref:DUF3742 family protein n=1 Tax=Burkholderia cenocepacia TaxID=95486 RepID=A0ABD4UIY4_9BURK|nr:DUF3742 family protein [Burkholderia cenocepacia]MCW3662518.1 DUF3742 family protein [Burkholderia cenocepacia]MCW3697932.1 DUF3742 family protein [Burkholderia cenocepacia]MCW3705653.1 DUF3742 family protein [Burkholderia cenocepacia]MCW3714016.1 DUF3742 family protein [Burkholderia cenocepacia]MCW3722092.1 DUF3742 family protein [Burkholderia cenocepacia]
MNTTTRISFAERIGRTFGRGWRAYAHGERRTSNWLVSKGVPVMGTTVLLWAVKLVVLGLLLYVAFWFAVVLLAVVAAGWAAAANASDDDEWPFTDLTELRKTPGYDPNLYNDTSHEMYTDE